MARWCIVSFSILVAVVTIPATSALNKLKECPPGNPTCHIWQPCDYDETQGVQVSCLDCNNRIICTPFGGWVAKCWLFGQQYCLDGGCVSQPSDNCAPQTTEYPTSESVTAT